MPPQVHRQVVFCNLVKLVKWISILNFDQNMALPCSGNSVASNSFASIQVAATAAESEASDRGIRAVGRNRCFDSI